MKADVRSRIGREEYLLFFFFFGCSVDPGRGDCPSRNHCGQCCFECEDLPFSFYRAIDRTGGFVVFAFSFFILFLFFTRFLQSAFPASHTRELLHTYHRIPGKERRLGYIWAGLCFSSIDIRLDVYCNDNLSFPELFPKHREMIYFP